MEGYFDFGIFIREFGNGKEIIMFRIISTNLLRKSGDQKKIVYELISGVKPYEEKIL